ncbi:MAG: hypothetical protein F6K65_19680 [Moorea sp. SIO3C2]|nr:hypothetical protein [Moorena sp. SIO3C2]
MSTKSSRHAQLKQPFRKHLANALRARYANSGQRSAVSGQWSAIMQT